MRELTRREFLENISLIGLVASGCLPRPEGRPYRRISTDFSKATSPQSPAPSTGTETQEESSPEEVNTYTTRMLYSDKGMICLRESESQVRQLIEGELAEWDSGSRIFFKTFKGVNKVHVYSINSGNVEILPNLESFPIISPDGKNFLQVINGAIINSNWLEGNRLYSFLVQEGSNPRWVIDGMVLYVSKKEELKLSSSGIISSNRFSFCNICRGFDVSRDRKEAVYAETCPNVETNQDKNSVRGYTQLCFADLEKVRERMGVGLEITVERLYTKETKSNEPFLIEFLGPKISPDGEKVGFVEVYGKNLENMNVRVYDRGEKEPREIKAGLKRDYNIPHERIVEWLDDSENLAVNHSGKISVFNINTGKTHTFPGKNVSVYHSQEDSP